MKLGTLKEIRNSDNTTSLFGNVTTYSMNLHFQLTENPDRQSDKSPTHQIYASGEHGGQFHAGSAWFGTTKTGEPMYSLIIHVPELNAEEMRFAAWQESIGQYRIENSIPQKEAA